MTEPKRLEGYVATFNREKFYGFVTTELPGSHGRSPGIYFGVQDIKSDWRGSTAHTWVPGTPVTFVMVTRPSRKHNGVWTGAADVCPIFLEEPTESLDTYREMSTVKTWNGCFGELQRECGDTIFFHKSGICSQFANRVGKIQVGDWIYSGVGQRNDGRWQATRIELYGEEEQANMKRSVLAQEAEATQEIPEAVPEILSPQNRNRSIVELIAERRANGKAQK